MVSSFGRVISRSARGPLQAARKPQRRPAGSGRPPTLEPLEDRTLLTGSWTALANPVPSPTGTGTMMLLSDGTVMVQDGGSASSTGSSGWYQLTPDATGSYVNGTWSQLASMNVGRLYFGSAVLPDGRVFVVGGEYSSEGGFSRSGEIYDPVANTWTRTANFPQSMFGDDPVEVLPDGRVLAGYVVGPQTYIYDPAANSWTQTGTKLNSDQSDEETWVKLPDNSILTYNIFALGTAQRYLPASGTWVATGPAPNNLSSSGVGEELGPAFLLPDGRVFYIGATGHTAYYDTATDSWTSGPDVPGGLGADDAPGAELPNGKILFAADRPLFNGPTSVFEFDPSTNTYTNVTPSISGMSESRASYFDRMVVLPTGQVLYTTSDDQLAVYTPDGTAVEAAKPTITGILPNGDGTYTLTGTQLNGISEGSTYGDDALNASNYPIVQLTASDGTVTYARTYGWNATGVGPANGATSVQFSLPPGVDLTNQSVVAIANGIASDPVNLETAGPVVLRSAANSTLPGVSSVRVTFNESIIPRTFEDLARSNVIQSFTDPNGNPIAVTSVTAVHGTHDRQFDVNFAGQFQAGTYTLVIGPNIKDMMHRQMDQDADGIAGQIPDDEYTATFAVASPQVTGFVSNGANGVPPTNVRVTFNEPMDPATFDTTKVTAFTDPNGNPVSVDSVTPVTGSNNTQFDIGFAPQTIVGNYSMTIGPDIQDFYGNSLPAAFSGTFSYTNNLLTNGGFETGNFAGWTLSGNTNAVTVSSTNPHSGSFAAQLGPSGSLGFLTQTVATTPGQSYTLIYWLLHPPTGGTPNEFQVFIGGTMVYDQVNLGNFPYTQFTFTYTATAATTDIRFGFREDPDYFYLDDVSFSPSGTDTGARNVAGTTGALDSIIPLNSTGTPPSASPASGASGTYEVGATGFQPPKTAESAATITAGVSDGAAHVLPAETNPMSETVLDNLFQEFA